MTRRGVLAQRKTLYAKIFGWFLLTAIVGSLAVLVLTFLSGPQLGTRWMRVTQDLYAGSAMDFYETGGAPALANYLDTLRTSSGMDAHLLRADGSDVLGHTVTPRLEDVLERSRNTGHSAFRMGRVWTTASPETYRGETFYFVAEVYPLRGFFDNTFALPAAGKLGLALLIMAGLCVLLARHIVRPIRALQHAATRLAAGDLNVRVLPAMGRRDDELTDTARAFDAMADRMQTLLERRQALLGDISHELRSPLTRMAVSLELMRRGETDVLEQMQTDVERMDEMIAQILLLTRMDVESAPPAFAPVGLVTMLQSIVQDADFEGKQANKAVLLHSEIAKDDSCMMRGDANLLRSGLENIVRNAVRYTAPGTAVEVRVRRVMEGAAAMWQVTVEDNGPGVPADALPHLFDAFYRVAESRDRAQGGTGLGLSISQKVVALHGGEIVAKNREDTPGLMVRVLLPCG